MPAELAPFLATAQDRLAADTEGLPPHEVIAHLESTVARAEIQAAQLGIRIQEAQQQPDAESLAVALGESDGDGPVVVVRRIIGPDEG